ncbi:MAG: DNA-binding protein [Ruminococcus sp.]|nr:DNA-binding protein [Ruminococcus sp.]
MNTIEKITNLDQLSGEQRDIAEVIGLESYRKLVEQYGGTHVYICKAETILRELRNNEIRSQFNGCNYRELAKKYCVSEMTVRKIVL